MPNLNWSKEKQCQLNCYLMLNFSIFLPSQNAEVKQKAKVGSKITVVPFYEVSLDMATYTQILL